MATYAKYEVFVEDLVEKVHNFTAATDSIRIILTNTTPNNATHATKSQATELGTSGGYTANGIAITMSTSRTGGTVSVIGADPAAPTWTGSGGGFTFSHVILFNDTPTSPADPLIANWPYGASQLVGASETLTVDFGASLFTVT